MKIHWSNITSTAACYMLALAYIALVWMAFANNMRPAEFGRYLLQCHCFGHATMLQHHTIGGMPRKGHD